MISLMDLFFISMIITALLLSVMGLWFTAIIPGLDHWSKRFFLSYFVIFFLSSISALMESLLGYYSFPIWAVYLILFLESLFLSVPLPMLTVYLVHCSGGGIRGSRLVRTVVFLWISYFALSSCSGLSEQFGYIDPNDQYVRGPLYPLLLAPLFMILLANLAGVIRRRSRLSRKVYTSFLVAIVPMAFALLVQMFVDVFPLVDIAIILCALSMYSFALSDQIERDRRNRQEIARQQLEIAQERANVKVLQMRPHFIYNTLMSIYSLCNLDPQKARQVTMDFTNYLRKNFNAVASDNAIPFTAELEHTRAYLAVEQAQHEDMLLVEYDTQFTHFRLPPLTLQPIVENAVKHGMNPYSGPLQVSVRTRNTDSGAEIVVEDNGTGFDPNDESKPHTALANIKQRLEMMCNGTMTILPREGGGTVVTITIPPAQAAPE